MEESRKYLPHNVHLSGNLRERERERENQQIVTVTNKLSHANKSFATQILTLPVASFLAGTLGPGRAVARALDPGPGPVPAVLLRLPIPHTSPQNC